MTYDSGYANSMYGNIHDECQQRNKARKKGGGGVVVVVGG